jgi:hypothetical protein
MHCIPPGSDSPSALTEAKSSPDSAHDLNVLIGSPNPSLTLPLQEPRISTPPPRLCFSKQLRLSKAFHVSSVPMYVAYLDVDTSH